MLNWTDQSSKPLETCMKRKGRSKSEQKHQQILDAAIALFVIQGYHNTSMDQIATRAAVSKQTLYSHFDGKQELFKRAIQTRHSDYDLTESSLRESSDSLRESLLKLGTALLELLLSEDGVCAHRVCCAEAETHPEVAAVFFQEGPEHITAIVSRYLSQQCAAGLLAVENPRHAAIQLVYMLKGEAQMRALLNQAEWSKEEVRAYISSCVDMFLRAYGRQPTRGNEIHLSD
jgi:AcrR family transcriptional regulator